MSAPRDLVGIAGAAVGSEGAAFIRAAEGLDVHAALNTYEVMADVAPGVYVDGDMCSVVGANRRRLIVRPQDGTAWIGGCLIESVGDLHRLISTLTGMAVAMEIHARNGYGAVCYCGTGREHPRGQGYHCAKGDERG